MTPEKWEGNSRRGTTSVCELSGSDMVTNKQNCDATDREGKRVLTCKFGSELYALRLAV